MSQDQPFIWKSSFGGPISWVGQSLGILKVGQTVLARLMESLIWQQPGGSVALHGEGLEKGQWPLLAPMPDTSASPNIPLVPFKLPPWSWSSEEVKSEYVNLYVGSLRGTASGFRSFFRQLNPHWFLQPEVVETYLHGTGTWEA